jgi:hypothetical protein
MAISEEHYEQAERRMRARRKAGYAVAARYDPRTSRVIVRLNTGVELTFPPSLMEGLTGGSQEQLAAIEISPAGLGLHWPKLDADVYIPALLQGIFGSRRWMAAQLGAAGGRARSEIKTASSRVNGRKGGRPKTKVSSL